MDLVKRFRPWLRAHWGRLLYRVSEEHAVEGIVIALYGPLDSERGVLLNKLHAALELLKTHDQRSLERIRLYAKAIWVHMGVPGYGAWNASQQLIELQDEYVMSEETTPPDVASTLVHEATHAWLTKRGIAYDAGQRARVEAVCYRTELVFLRRVSGVETELITQTEAQLDLEESTWRTGAYRSRELDRLTDLGVPKWLRSTIDWFAKRARSRAA